MKQKINLLNFIYFSIFTLLYLSELSFTYPKSYSVGIEQKKLNSQSYLRTSKNRIHLAHNSLYSCQKALLFEVRSENCGEFSPFFSNLIPVIMYRFKTRPSDVKQEFFKVFGQNVLFQIINIMPSKVRLLFDIILLQCQKVVIFASECSLVPGIWWIRGKARAPGPPTSTTGLCMMKEDITMNPITLSRSS